MNEAEIQALVAGIAPVLKAFVDERVAAALVDADANGVARADAAKAIAEAARADVVRLADQFSAAVTQAQQQRDAAVGTALDAHRVEILSDIGRVASEHAQALRDVQAMVERLSAPPAQDDADVELLAAAIADRFRALPALTDG